MTAVLEITDIRKSFGITAVDGVSWRSSEKAKFSD